MDLQEFQKIVDRTVPGIVACEDDLHRLYDYVGLEQGLNYTRQSVSDALYAQIKGCFTSGHNEVWRICKSMRTELIRQHVLSGRPLDPYFEVIDHLQDATRSPDGSRAPVQGDWSKAIGCTIDHIQIHSWGSNARMTTYARDFKVAEAARGLRDAGFAIQLEPGRLSLEESAEKKLIATIEDLIASMGGLNVLRRIFDAIEPHYDAVQQRYHLVRHISMVGGGEPQIPWGYLIQLAVKHAKGRKPYTNTDSQWQRLCSFSTAFAAIIDVQPYIPNYFGKMDAMALIKYLQEMAIYDTLFRVHQMRPTDVVKIVRGMFDWLDTAASTKAGWSVDQVLEIVSYLLTRSSNIRGPIFLSEAEIQRACATIPRDSVTQILNQVLSHPASGANQSFSRPTDAPILENPDLKHFGYDFFLRPLLHHHSGRQFILIDRSVCASACIEALLTQLRLENDNLDEQIGLAVERFLASEFALHRIPTCSGDYDAGGEHGQCDLVVEAPTVVIFFELKKKVLTRRAKAGSDAHLLLDLAGSLLTAQVQAGWHEVRLRNHEYLDLERDKVTKRLERNGREIERVAVSLSDFGSFQDRMLLKQVFEATMNVAVKPEAASLKRKFDEINTALAEIREQVAALYPGQKYVKQPFFNCWFLSVPQLLVLLDGVFGAAEFKAALWKCRHIVTGASDFYFDLSLRRLR